MSSPEHRERERARRHQLIITAARELAETEGWDAVTTRRLAERVEYSQPVLYNHFKGKDAIVRRGGRRGLRRPRRRAAAGPADRGLAREALARRRSRLSGLRGRRAALYAAMFVLETDVAQEAREEREDPSPAPAFEELVAVAGRGELDAEVIWSALHGLAVLARAGGSRRGGRGSGWTPWSSGSPPDAAGHRKASAGQDSSGTAGAVDA